jgi:hypothetical protein
MKKICGSELVVFEVTIFKFWGHRFGGRPATKLKQTLGKSEPKLWERKAYDI